MSFVSILPSLRPNADLCPHRPTCSDSTAGIDSVWSNTFSLSFIWRLIDSSSFFLKKSFICLTHSCPVLLHRSSFLSLFSVLKSPGQWISTIWCKGFPLFGAGYLCTHPLEEQSQSGSAMRRVSLPPPLLTCALISRSRTAATSRNFTSVSFQKGSDGEGRGV